MKEVNKVKVAGGTYVTKLADLKYWETVDPNKTGHIPVFFQGEIVIARPKFPPFSLKVPTKEFVEKYIDSIGVFVEPAADYPGRLWWTGFTIFKGNVVNEVGVDYPYNRIVHFDEKWIIIAGSKVDKNYLKILHEDGSEFIIDPSNKIIRLFNAEASKEINIKEDTINLGSSDAAEPGVLGDTLESLLNEILDGIIAIKTNTMLGPQPPMNIATFQNIKTKVVDIKSEIIKLD